MFARCTPLSTGTTIGAMMLISTPYSLGKVVIGYFSVGSRMDLMERIHSDFSHHFYSAMNGLHCVGMNFCVSQAKTYVLYLTRYPSLPSYSQPTGNEPLQRSSQTPYLQ